MIKFKKKKLRKKLLKLSIFLKFLYVNISINTTINTRIQAPKLLIKSCLKSKYSFILPETMRIDSKTSCGEFKFRYPFDLLGAFCLKERIILIIKNRIKKKTEKNLNNSIFNLFLKAKIKATNDKFKIVKTTISEAQIAKNHIIKIKGKMMRFFRPRNFSKFNLRKKINEKPNKLHPIPIG
ncbi:MAG: hypothetical protein V4622_01610 [Bacteroidota bacterium]